MIEPPPHIENWRKLSKTQKMSRKYLEAAEVQGSSPVHEQITATIVGSRRGYSQFSTEPEP